MNLPLTLLVAGLALAAVPQTAPPPSIEIKGTVMETADAGGYTYLRLKTASGEQWAAVSQASVKKGSQARVVGSVVMTDFESKTLKRKFDNILFGALDGPATPSGKGNPHGGAMGGTPGGMAHGGRPAVDMGPVKVEKAVGPDARTVAEIYAQKAALKGKDVVVRGKVVKMNANIIDRNWTHLRDGTGSAKNGTDDLTVTLKDSAEVGQVITVRGKIFLNKDLGGMYKFPVLLEDATLVK